MANRKVNVKKNKQPKKRAIVSRPARSISPSLDAGAKEYMELIRDPCNAKLTTTIWPGANGSIVSRFEVDQILYSGATETAGMFVFCPGTNQTYGNITPLTTDGTLSTLGGGIGLSPGSTFLTNTAGSVRAVAACVQVTFPGTELNRSGIVAMGVTNFGALTANLSTAAGGGNVSTTAGFVRTLCQHTERMPQEMAEITWFPGSGDQTPFGTGLTTAAAITEETANKNAIVVSVSGFPVSTGVRFRTVYVCEWTPKTAQGLVATAEVPRSRATINDVLIDLHKAGGTNWFINAYKKAQPYLRAAGSVISYGAKLLGPAMMAI